MKSMGRKALLLGIGTVAAAAFSVFFTGCGGGSKDAKKREITVVSREESSGTRGAFDELMKITDGKTNELFREAVIVSSTDEAASKVEVDKNAIGYTSIGSLNEKVKAVSIGGVAATEDNVQNGSYKISRPFVLATKNDGNNQIVDDFMAFVKSKQGQAVVGKAGYIMVGDQPEYSAAGLSGKITLSGSTSVQRVIERLQEAYIELNPNVRIEINYNGSSAGIKDCESGRSDVAMSSRALKAEEQAQLKDVTFALDGIAVIVNQSNAVSDLSAETITKIFKGEIRFWNDLQ
jgi:phosphate transport system substrate-binding protein